MKPVLKLSPIITRSGRYEIYEPSL